MEKIEKIKKKLEELKPILEEKYNIKSIGVFGSYVRGEEKKTSDLDILVEFREKEVVGFFKFIELEEYLRKILKVKKVDLVTKDALKPYMGREILKEVSYV